VRLGPRQRLRTSDGRITLIPFGLMVTGMTCHRWFLWQRENRMRNKAFGVIALLLGGGAIVRNLTEAPLPAGASSPVADWALPVIFVFIGIYLLTRKTASPN
jgi:uncharacterized membrane protein